MPFKFLLKPLIQQLSLLRANYSIKVELVEEITTSHKYEIRCPMCSILLPVKFMERMNHKKRCFDVMNMRFGVSE